MAQEHRALDCIECGSCSFICPARRPLLQSIRNAKKEIIAMKKKQAVNKQIGGNIVEKKLIVSSSPHVRSNEDTSYIMKQVVIALIPAALAGV